MWCHLFTKFASYNVPLVMVSTHGSVVPLAMFCFQTSIRAGLSQLGSSHSNFEPFSERERSFKDFLSLTFTVGPLVEDMVFVFGTLFGQRSLLEPFDLVQVLCEAVLAVLLVNLPLHL